MAQRKPPSRAIQALCKEINETGRKAHGERWRDVGPRKIERWLQDDLLIQPHRPGLGQGLGRRVLYDASYVGVGVEIAELLREHKSADLAALVLFVRCRPVSLDRVRRGYLKWIERFNNEIKTSAMRQRERVPGSDDTPANRAQLAEPVIAARIRRGKYGQALHTQLNAQSGIETLVAVGLNAFLGNLPETAENMYHVARSLEIDRLFAVMPDLHRDLNRLASYGNKEKLTTLVNTASDNDFIEARDAHLALIRLYRSISQPTEFRAAIDGPLRLLSAIEHEVGEAISVLGLLARKLELGCSLGEFVASIESAITSRERAHPGGAIVIN